MKNWIHTLEGELHKYRKPTPEEETRLLSVPKEECKHELVHKVSGFTTDEIICSNCGHLVVWFGS